MALEAKGSPLVAGQAPAPDSLITVRVVRGFLDHQKIHRYPGDIVVLPARFGREMLSVNKAVVADVKPTVALAGTATLTGKVDEPEPKEKGSRHVKQ